MLIINSFDYKKDKEKKLIILIFKRSKMTEKNTSKNNKKNKIILKILTLGDSAVGKSALLVRYTQNKFNSGYLSTVGIDYQSKKINYQNRDIEMQIWDSAGQEKYRAISKQYYKKANGILLLYDVTSRESFLGIKEWIRDINNMVTMKPSLILVGNKIDLERKVLTEEGEELSKKYNMTKEELLKQFGGIEMIKYNMQMEKAIDELFLDIEGEYSKDEDKFYNEEITVTKEIRFKNKELVINKIIAMMETILKDIN